MRTILFFAALGLAACDRDRPPAPTSQESRQLDEAEDMLNEMADEKGAAPVGTAPSNSD